ncbi:uncharacterized protein FIBRA_04797 [Fibroporia radiculosa]|uniref:Cytochrome P450 n=1 Tax=Fibroporia radiculosa TaxID=599839 RepID=J4IAC9_9APHY|nr:uncharacterized protein FIBRA_04797 [Fibroporia radiculosa]CCM02691.1 predicted protein [Fibroporia radiculosa]
MENQNLHLLLFLLGIAFLTWRRYNRQVSASVLHKVPGPPRTSFWTGNLPEYLSRHGSEFQRHVALDYGPVSKIHGRMGRVIPYIADPKALHTILIKEEHIFQETDGFITSNMLMFGPGLLGTVGDMHRRQRKLLNPAFSTAHMRHMLPIFYQIVYKLRDAISAQLANGAEEVDMLNWMGRTALELVGQGGLGYSFDPLVEVTENEYGNALKNLFPNMQELFVLREFITRISTLGPAWVRRQIVDMIPHKNVQNLKSIVDTMSQQSQSIYNAKKAAISEGDEALLQQIGEGKDIMSLLMRANAATSDTDRLPEYELVSQMSTLVLAATDTTSNSLTRILEILAGRPDAQEKLRQEILDASAADGLSYDELDQLPFLDSVCRETLRLNPPLVLIFRQAMQDTVVPLSEPIVGTDGSMISELPIPKGTEVIAGILGCNASKALWGEDALEWKPERWLSPLPSAVTKNTIPGVYSNLMTFIGGKRSCIGFKFSEMEIKVVLSVLLTHFRFHLTDKPIEWNVAAVRYPTVGKTSDIPQLPLRVELLKS